MLKIIAIASIIAAPLVSQADRRLEHPAAQQIQICKTSNPAWLRHHRARRQRKLSEATSQ